MGKNLPLPMTASVSTRGMKGERYTDEEREQMYVDTLTYYIVHLLKIDPVPADQNSLKNKMKRLVGNGFRKLLPWIWI